MALIFLCNFYKKQFFCVKIAKFYDLYREGEKYKINEERRLLCR